MKTKVVIHNANEYGILLHNPAGMGQNGKSTRKVIPTPEEEARTSCYWTDDGRLALPAMNIYSGLVQAASGLKLPTNRKQALSPYIAGDVQVEPMMIPFVIDGAGADQAPLYRVDTRRATVQRQGIMRSRARISPFTLEFVVSWEPQWLGDDFYKTILPELLLTLGSRIGIGDFRPAKKGPFGKFVVKNIELM